MVLPGIAWGKKDATTKDFGCLPLVKIEFFSHLGDVVGINEGGINFPLKQPSELAVAVAVFAVQDNFATSRAEVARYRWNGSDIALISVWMKYHAYRGSVHPRVQRTF